MKDLNVLLKQMQAHENGMTLEQYLGHFTEVTKEQRLFKLESCEGDTGFLLRNEDGCYHIWYVSTSTSPLYEGERYHVTETGSWYPNQLNEAMTDLMLQMKIDCAGLIERNGVKIR